MKRLALACLLLLPALAAYGQPPGISGYSILEYYEQSAAHNPVAALAAQLAAGERTLEYRDDHGYLLALLEALEIDPSSQVLVFSPTSLQHALISPARPRALYFNEHTYVGYVQDSTLLEVTTLDEKQGIVFYVFNNAPAPERYVERINQRCLVCHDSTGTMGGGVPTLMALSSLYDENGVKVRNVINMNNVEDHTPLWQRWGGWYVTGKHGSQQHLGNVLLPRGTDVAGETVEAALSGLDPVRRDNLDTLAGTGLVETALYPRATSDIVALMVLEHQLTVQNRISYVRFKAPTVLARARLTGIEHDHHWETLPPRARQILTRMLDALVDRLLMLDSIRLAAPISGDPAFRDWFEARGLADAEGRSLRTLDLDDRLFRYPLSYLVHSADFNSLPQYARDYVWTRLLAILEGRERSARYAVLTAADREAVLAILQATAPDTLAQYSTD